MPQALPEWMHPSTRIIRRPVNPMDKSTIVSIFPLTITVENPTIFPGKFEIVGAPADDYSLFIVEPSSWFKEMEEGMPFLEIPVGSIELAQSIINDWSNGLPGCNMNDIRPGLFMMNGAKTKLELLTDTNFKLQLEWARECQKRWWTELVKMTDADWARSNGNPRSVSHLARIGAEFLHIERPWLRDIKITEMKPCQFCGNLTNPMYPICANCKNITNRERAIELGMLIEPKVN